MVSLIEDQASEDERLLLRIPQVQFVLSVGRSTVYDLINAGELETVHMGRAVRVTMDSVKAWFNRQPKEKSN